MTSKKQGQESEPFKPQYSDAEIEEPQREDIGKILFAWRRLMGVFGAAVCHDLNNPLQGVVGFLDLLLQTEENPQRKADLDYVLDCGLQCRELADGLGRLVERYPPASTSFDVESYWEEVLSRCRKDWAEKELEFHPKLEVLSPPEEIDPYYFLTMVYGTLGEACLRAPMAGNVTIKLTLGGDERLRMVVDLEPPHLGGVPLKDFETTDKASNELGFDKGLGLWLARRAARLQGGRLEGDFRAESGAQSVLILLPHRDN